MQAVSSVNGLRTRPTATTRDPLNYTYPLLNCNKQKLKNKRTVAQMVTDISQEHPASSFYSEDETSTFLRNASKPNHIPDYTMSSP
jgi:hypothetical protein